MKIVTGIIDGEKNIQSPFHKDGFVKSIFVITDKTHAAEKIGYLLFWCSITNKGAAFSRLKIPENAEYTDSENLKNLDIPEIKFQNISFY